LDRLPVDQAPLVNSAPQKNKKMAGMSGTNTFSLLPPKNEDQYSCVSAEILQWPSKEKIHVRFEYPDWHLASGKCGFTSRDVVAAR
jgi:hypothetical protein